MLQSDLCDYSDAYIFVERDITFDGDNIRDRKNKSLAFKSNASLISCISKINSVLIENAEDLDVVMPMYNLLKYSKNIRKTTGSLQNYYRDEPNTLPFVDPPTNPPTLNYNGDPITNSASFKYKGSIIGKTPDNDNDDNNVIKNAEIVVPLKHLGKFWNSSSIPLVNCEVNIILTWSKNCVLTDMIATSADDTGNLPVIAINAPTNAAFAIKVCKLYVSIVTLSAENDNKLLEQLKTGFKRHINKLLKCAEI